MGLHQKNQIQIQIQRNRFWKLLDRCFLLIQKLCTISVQFGNLQRAKEKLYISINGKGIKLYSKWRISQVNRRRIFWHICYFKQIYRSSELS
ncbi:unnamed protein product [Paramecium pentaurelia]|uniref:Uncharacterized protein n=1 Tax=Paramecium pentaurelia TaxID=43138 RepID=A0A8S1TMU7_9CILI|nr:unnamed protein product [Paramecium pentaurelia]